jgi:hypothetical protein
LVFVAGYALVALAAVIAFGIFYAREEKKNTALCLIGIAAGVLVAAYMMPALIQGAMIFMGLYVADAKNRRRLPWALASFILGPAVILPLIYMRRLPSDVEQLTLLGRES